MLEYEIVKRPDLSALIEKVRDEIREGWAPLGAPFIDLADCYQAMTRNPTTWKPTYEQD